MREDAGSSHLSPQCRCPIRPLGIDPSEVKAPDLWAAPPKRAFPLAAVLHRRSAPRALALAGGPLHAGAIKEEGSESNGQGS